MHWTVRLVPVLVVVGVVMLVGWAASAPQHPRTSGTLAETARTEELVDRISVIHSGRWERADVAPAGDADDLTVLRRLSLALHGTIPSLSEICEFESDDRPGRLARWTERMLDDPRFADYFATRLARSFVGAEQGQFVLFRRDRYESWLVERLRENTPLDEVVRDMISEGGLWTDAPATNFVTAAFANGELDHAKLAARSVRAFLGQRIDCAQCHDHPFDDWTQHEFEGLAAYFGSSRVSLVGIEDVADLEFTVEDRETLRNRAVEPAVPFGMEWLPNEGTRRERLAAWITHPQNVRFERAIANRAWGLVFGTPYSAGAALGGGRPVDDLPDPPDEPDVLTLLGGDFRGHGYDLRRLIHAITATRAFRARSRPAVGQVDDPTAARRNEAEWAVFPLVRLRPEQVIGAMLQSASVSTIDRNSQLLVRVVRFLRERDFVREYGDLGDDELGERAGTIPQALLRMNGRLVREIGEANPFTAAGRIASFSGDSRTAVENAFLACLTRCPTDEERAFFAAWFDEASTDAERSRAVEDLYWTLFNSPEFAWNH